VAHIKICSVKGCNNKHDSKGYCTKHYKQFLRYGKILTRTVRDPNEIIVYQVCAEIVLYNKICEEIARTKISLDKVEICRQYKWHLTGHLNDKQYCSTIQNGKQILLHRFITGANKKDYVDHYNKDTLDNRNNLRICTNQENRFNSCININNTSGVKGVSYDKCRNKWTASITYNGKKIYLGRHENIEDAKKTREEAELKYFGEFSPLYEANKDKILSMQQKEQSAINL